MPDFGNKIGDRSFEATAGLTLVSASGDRFTTHLTSTKSTTSQDEVDDWASAVGGCTNRGLLEARLSQRKYLPDVSEVLCYDEHGETAVFVFQEIHDPKKIQYVTIPDFDASLYDAGGIKLDATAVTELITETKQIIDDGANVTYELARAYIRGANGKRRLLTLALSDTGHAVDMEEPTALGEPGGGPAGVV